MTDTINIPVTRGEGWKQISGFGLMFITANKPMEFAISATTPNNTLIGHHMKTFGLFNFASNINQLFVRGEGVLTITPDSSLNPSGEPFPQGVFTGTRAITSQSYTEANVKNGVQFSASSIFTGILAGENLDIIFITGDKPVAVKSQYIATKNASDVISDLYENPTYTGGENLDAGVFNQTRINPEPSTITLVGLAPTDADNYDYTPNDATKPNVTNEGVKFQPSLSILGTSGQGNSVTSRAGQVGLETILKPNTAYLYRRHCVEAVDSFFGFTTWYEGDLDLPL